MYRNFLAVFFSGFIFSNLIIYIYNSGILPIPPFISLGLFFVACFPLLLEKKTLQFIASTELSGWILYYIILSILFGFFSACETEYILTSVTQVTICVVTILIALIIFQDNASIKFAQYSIFFLCFLGLIFNIIDIIKPLTFSKDIGRAGGLYENANYAGASLVMGLFFSENAFGKRARYFLIIATGIAIFLTFSRAALFFFLLYLFVTRKIHIRNIVPVLVVVIISIVVLTPFIKGIIPDQINISEFLKQRFAFLDPSASSGGFDESANERKILLEMGWEKYLDRPIWGYGLGGHESIARGMYQNQLSHNTYVGLLLNYGIFGLSIIVFLVIAIINNVPEKLKPTFFLLAIFILLNGFFSHNLFDNYNFLLFYGIFAAFKQVEINNISMKNLA